MSNIQEWMIIITIIISFSMTIFLGLLLLWIKQIPERKQRQFRDTMFKHICEMQTEEEFKSIYQQILNNIDVRTIKRRHIKNTIIELLMSIMVFSLIGVVVFLLLIAPILFETEINGSAICLIIFMLPVVLIVMSRFIEKEDNKTQIIQKLILAVEPNIRYKEMEEHIYVIRELCEYAGFRDKYNTHRLTDYMEYELSQNVKVKLADVFLGIRARRGGTTCTFEGITAKVAREKIVTNEILIERKRFFESRYKFITDGEFDEIFDLSVLNKEDAETRINARVRNEIVRLYKQYGIMFEISLKGNFLYVRFYTGDLFDGKWSGSIIDEKKLHREYVIFKSILKIIERLNEIV